MRSCFLDVHDHLPPEMIYDWELLICRFVRRVSYGSKLPKLKDAYEELSPSAPTLAPEELSLAGCPILAGFCPSLPGWKPPNPKPRPSTGCLFPHVNSPGQPKPPLTRQPANSRSELTCCI